MAAAHVWDAIDAQTVSYSGALITRSGNAPLLVREVPQPNYIAPDLVEIAKQLIAFKDRAEAR
jgi:2-haloacid dehalogenase